MALIDDFKARFPEFDGTLVDNNLPRLQDVWPYYFNKEYSTLTKEVILNLNAHLLVLDQNGSPSSIQELTSTSVGSVSESYASKSDSSDRNDFFRSTKYGQAFLMLSKFCGGISFQ